MRDADKIKIAKEFVALHKDSDISRWSARFQHFSMTDDEKYLHVFGLLMGGDYGEVRDNAEYGDDGEVAVEPTEYEIEIGRFDSKTGNPVIFEFSK